MILVSICSDRWIIHYPIITTDSITSSLGNKVGCRATRVKHYEIFKHRSGQKDQGRYQSPDFRIIDHKTKSHDQKIT